MSDMGDFEGLADLLENASVSIHLVGRDGTVLWANRQELEGMGYASEEYVNKNIKQFHANEEVINDILARLLRFEEIKNYPAILLTKEGKKKHVIISSNVYKKDGEFEHTRCFTSEVNEDIFNVVKSTSPYTRQFS
ncbi:MAG: PAS domain-containing protein [Methyloprofundus sp.]|nr:PAS domain-containing protein [Methyloprofundus sp.]